MVYFVRLVKKPLNHFDNILPPKLQQCMRHRWQSTYGLLLLLPCRSSS